MAHEGSFLAFRPPSVDKLLQTDRIKSACLRYGRALVTDAVRDVLASFREEKNFGSVIDQDHSIKLIVDEGGGITIVLLDSLTYLALDVWHFVKCDTIT